MTAQGPTNTLIALPSTNGAVSLSPGGGVYVKDTGVQVTANGILGYAFSSWGGALAGSTNNPAIIVIDTNKTISANYVAVPTYTLTTSATNGSVTLNPPGGVYNAGTVVTVTAKANRGYQFGSWSGNLTGTHNPTTITMNGNKSVTANFTVLSGDVAPWLETFTLANGTMTDGAPTAWTATRSIGTVSGQRQPFDDQPRLALREYLKRPRSAFPAAVSKSVWRCNPKVWIRRTTCDSTRLLMAAQRC